MKFSEKMCLNIILKVTKKQGFILSLEDAFLEKLQWGKGGGELTPLTVLGLRLTQRFSKIFSTAWYCKNIFDHDIAIIF